MMMTSGRPRFKCCASQIESDAKYYNADSTDTSDRWFWSNLKFGYFNESLFNLLPPFNLLCPASSYYLPNRHRPINLTPVLFTFYKLKWDVT
jgi:hypothetical protein